jgi:hypothetical protein
MLVVSLNTESIPLIQLVVSDEILEAFLLSRIRSLLMAILSNLLSSPLPLWPNQHSQFVSGMLIGLCLILANRLRYIPLEWSVNPYWRGRLGTVDLLVLTSLDHLVILLKILITFYTKQATIMRRSTALSLPYQLVVPGVVYSTPGACIIKHFAGIIKYSIKLNML